MFDTVKIYNASVFVTIHSLLTFASRTSVKCIYLFIPEFLKRILPSLNLVRTTFPNMGLSEELKKNNWQTL